MSRKKTHDEYVEELAIKNPNIEVLEQYVDTKTSISHKCLIHSIIWQTTPTRALSGVGCNECKKDRFHQTRCRSHQQYVEEVKRANPNVDVIGHYVNARTKIEHYCTVHDVFWYAYPDNILRGMGCTVCGIEKTRNSTAKSHDEYVTEVYETNPNVEVIEAYSGANTPILHRCKIDGHVWYATPANILFGKGCPICKESKGEREIRQWLARNKILNESQKTFCDCKDVKMLPFDFYLPEYNVLIEYDGEQHYRPIELFGGEDGFKLRKKHDDIKTQYCKDNDIHLLRIPYYASVNEELEKFLFI